jgi:hypothetical protein
VLKDYTSSDTVATLYGKEVHKALEDYVRDSIPLAKNYQRFKAVVDELIAIEGTKYCEHEMALLPNKEACDFNDETRWVRGIADLLIVDKDIAYVIDYKTGSQKYPDPKQLRLMSLMVFANFPDVQVVKGGLLFVMHGAFITEEYNRNQIDDSWGHFTPLLARLDNSYKADTWVPNPTGLCRFCAVKSCEFNKG